jgi:hypothetical protein
MYISAEVAGLPNIFDIATEPAEGR